MTGFIYKITNDINDKVYIGKTLHASIEQRWNEHLKDYIKRSEEKRPLYNAMQAYGAEHFQIEAIECVPIEQLAEREKFWIAHYNSYSNGYNATRGGDGKMLYDYNAIVLGFRSGKLVQELAQEFGCCVDVISQALKLANIDSSENANKQNCKGLRAIDPKTNSIIQQFESRAEAAAWLKEKGLAAASAQRDNIIAAIGRAANGQRKLAYKIKWENF